jgi:tRNA/tmRNA/rRNA uracil-C5-methylase (TrmA/RlmC/RlmD family)
VTPAERPDGAVVGRRLVLDVGAVAHGGHCVARHDGQVVFVRHALPGERVVAEVTAVGGGGRFLRADAVEVLDPSPQRVVPGCPHAGPGRCGGCDWQHASLPEQQRLKAAVLVDALRRQGGLATLGGRQVEDAVEVALVPGAGGRTDGLRWRTRVDYVVADGRVGLHRHRSHGVEPVDDCRIAAEEVAALPVARCRWPGVTTMSVTASSVGDRLVAPQPSLSPGPGRSLLDQLPRDVAVAGVRGRSWVAERAAGRDWRVSDGGFWQVHPGAADTLVACVRDLLRPRRGEHLLDLYSGVGLFAGALSTDIGPEGRIDAVESSHAAVRDARRNLHDLPQVRLHEDRVRSWLRRRAVPQADLVVLDPPRAGAGPDVVRELLARRPRAVAYVSCDPITLARDLRVAREHGWEVAAVRGFDLFPMTHHLEAVALLVPAAAGAQRASPSGAAGSGDGMGATDPVERAGTP